jgi:hypothetical protein
VVFSLAGCRRLIEIQQIQIELMNELTAARHPGR